MNGRQPKCPGCGSTRTKPSVFGTTLYRDHHFNYLDCEECRSIFVDPMPDQQTVAQMYGPDYLQFLSTEESHGGEESVKEVLTFLSENEKGVFLDYGCGAGKLLKDVSNIGWEAVGFEFDPATAAKYSAAGGVRIVSDVNDLGPEFSADVVYLGDVVEHLTELEEQFPRILELVRPGGYLMAHGPLEANRNLFFRVLRLRRRLNPGKIQNMPPYHVFLATTHGQQWFFRRFGLEQLLFRTFESEHPAPSKLSVSDLTNLRNLSLFAVRKISQAVTKLSNAQIGNRYFYVGRRNASEIHNADV